MPDASRYCKRPPLELGARGRTRLCAAIRRQVLAQNPDDLERSVARPSVQERRKAKLKPGKPGRLLGPGPTHFRAAVEAVTLRRRRHARRPRWILPSTRRSIAIVGSVTIVASLRCAASAREPPSSPKHSFNPPRTVAPLPALDHEPYASPARTRALSIPT